MTPVLVPIRRMFTRAVIVMVACVAAGCAATTEPEETVFVGLTARSAARDSLGFADIGFTVTNVGNRAVYVQRCGATVSADIDQRTESSSTWQLAFMSSAGCYSSLWLGPYRLEPGRSVSGRQSARLRSGEVRLRVQISADSAQSAPRFISSDPLTLR